MPETAHCLVSTIFGLKLTLWPLKTYILYSMNMEWNSDVLHPSCYFSHTTCFTAIHNSSPVASWHSKVSTECALQNVSGSSRSSRYTFRLMFFRFYVFRHTTYLFAYCIHGLQRRHFRYARCHICVWCDNEHSTSLWDLIDAINIWK